MKKLSLIVLALHLLLAGCVPYVAPPGLTPSPAVVTRRLGSRLESGRGYRLDEEGMMVVHLRGSDAEMQAQYRALLSTEIEAFQAAARAHPDMRPFVGACSNIAAFGPASADSSLWHGRNFDFPGRGVLDVYRVVYIVEPDGRIPYAAISWSGTDPWNYVGVHTAMNARGISLGYMLSDAEGETIHDTPILWDLFRQIMENARSIDQAVDILRAAPRRGAANLLIADGSVPDAVVVEMTSDAIAVRRARAGTVYATNHFVSPELADPRFTDHNSAARYERFQQLAARSGAFDLDLAAAVLRDRVDSATGAASPNGDVIGNPLNMLSVVFHPADGTFWVAVGPAPSSCRAFVGFSLSDELDGTQAQTRLQPVSADSACPPLQPD